MKDIDQLIAKLDKLTLIDFFTFWETQEDIFMIKYDGLRETKKYSVILIGKDSRFEVIRRDCSDLLLGIKEVMLRYKNVLV